MDRDEEIRLIAYQIWEEEGCPHGQDCEHWVRAELIWGSHRKQQKPRIEKRSVVKKASKRNKKNIK